MTPIGARLSTWVEIRVPHEFLNGSDIRPALQQMGCERTAKRMATCQFGKAGAFNGFLHSLLDHAWIQVMAAFYPGSDVLPAVPLGKHPRSDLRCYPDATLTSHSIQRLEHGHANQPNHLNGSKKPSPLKAAAPPPESAPSRYASPRGPRSPSAAGNGRPGRCARR